MKGAADVWGKALELMTEKLTETAINTWLSDAEAVDLSENRLVIVCPSDFKKQVIETRFLGVIKEVLFDLFAEQFDVVLFLKEEEEALTQFLGKQHPDALFEEERTDSGTLTFSTFVVGNSNKFAHAAATAVAQSPASAYNPLFIYGQSGLGKTHLLYAISHTVKENNKQARIVYLKGDQFSNELIDAIQHGKNTEFRAKYRAADLLLVDDVQFIAGKERTQEEFFHTFNSLYESGCQIVLTSDRPPMEIMRLDERLQSRFEWGLLADIQPPDYETRMAIIRKKGQQLGLNIPPDAVTLIADNITANIRQLEGAVKNLTAYRDLLNDDAVDMKAVNRAIKDIFKGKVEHIPTPDIIIQETAHFFSLSSEDLRGRGRTRNTATARQISMYIMRKLTALSLIDIGKEYGGRTGSGMDHSSVLSAIRKIEEQVKDDIELGGIVRDIMANVHARL